MVEGGVTAWTQAVCIRENHIPDHRSGLLTLNMVQYAGQGVSRPGPAPKLAAHFGQGSLVNVNDDDTRIRRSNHQARAHHGIKT